MIIAFTFRTSTSRHATARAVTQNRQSPHLQPRVWLVVAEVLTEVRGLLDISKLLNVNVSLATPLPIRHSTYPSDADDRMVRHIVGDQGSVEESKYLGLL